MYWNDPTQQSGATVGTAAPAKKRSRTGLWITLGIVAALLVVGGGAGAFTLIQYSAPAVAASQFCNDLKTQNYDSAYNMLSAKLQATYNKDQFHTANGVLDVAEGKVTACGAASGNGSYDYSLGGSKATVKATITRATQGPLTGNLQLVNESGWKIDTLDTALLGINLGALQTLGAFCQAEQTQNYDTAYDLLSSSLQSPAPKAQFSALALLQDLIDGKVTACAIKSIASGNTDTSTTVTMTVTRATLGAATGNISLDGTGGTWKISKIDQAVQGTNPQPLLVGTELCLYIAVGQKTPAYALTSAHYQQTHTLAQFQQYFASHLPSGGKWLLGEPDLKTYKVTASTAQYSGVFGYTKASLTPLGVPMSLAFVLESGSWKVDAITLGRS